MGVNGMKNDLTRIFCSVLALTILAGPGIVRAQEAHSQSAISSELAEMHRADQADRQSPINWEVVSPRDLQRRGRVLEIIREEKLATAEDYYHAAMVFQHSNPGAEDYSPQQYLLAHALAMIAGFKGHEQAKWLSAAALDRYLTFTKQEQFFGTQYVRDNNNLWRPGDYSRMLTGKLRREFGLNAEEMRKRAESFNKPQP